MNVKGLKISDILDIDLDTFNRLNEKELRAITSRLVSAGNKRIRRLQEKEINSPALQGLGEEKTFSVKLSSDVRDEQKVNQLRSEFARARSFLTSETSTIGGYKKYVSRTTKRIAEELKMPEKELREKIDINKLFDIHHTAQERGLISSYRKSKGSMQGRSVIAEILVDNPNATKEDILRWLEENEDRLYKETQEESEDETEETELS